MASSQTAHYGLPIWKPEDNFLRTEFNESNQKIDAALGTLAAKGVYTTLIDTTTKSAAGQVSASLAGLALDGFHHLEARFYLPANTAVIFVRINGRSDEIYYTCNDGGTYSGMVPPKGSTALTAMSWTNQGNVEILLTLPLYMKEQDVTAFSRIMALPLDGRWNSVTAGRCVGLAWSSLKTIDVAGAIPAGTRVQVWGVK